MHLKVVTRIAIITVIFLASGIVSQADQREPLIGNVSASETDESYLIDSSDYLFPKNGLEKMDNATELAKTILKIFGMELKDPHPEIEGGAWKVIRSNNTQYTFIIGERSFYNKYENVKMTRLHELKLIYLGELFYRANINFDWNLGEDMEEDAIKIIDSMLLPSMDMRIDHMDVDGGLRIRSNDLGFNDTNFLEIFEKSAYYLDDGVWGKGREIKISAWLNVSWIDFPETEKFILNHTSSIYDFILENYNQSLNKEIVWIYGAWDRELTWFKLDPVNGSLRLSLWDELRFQYLFRIPEDNYTWYEVLIKFATSNGTILGSEDGYFAASESPGAETNYKIIHYQPGKQTKGDDNSIQSVYFIELILIFGITLFLAFFSALFLLFMVRRSKKRVLDNMSRKNIYDMIKKNQGIHFRDLMRKAEIKQGVLGYHLNILEAEYYIKSIQRGNKRCFFTRDDKGDLKLKLNVAQQRILNEINMNPGISLKDLARATSKSSTLVYYHTSILMDAGLINREKTRNSTHFFVSTVGQYYLA